MHMLMACLLCRKCADCDEANDEKALAACETCDSNVCFRCLAQSHIKSNHKWKNLSDVITERRDKWQEEIKNKWGPLYEQFNAAVAETKKMKRETDVARNNAREFAELCSTDDGTFVLQVAISSKRTRCWHLSVTSLRRDALRS